MNVPLEPGLIIVASLLLASVIASRAFSRLGIPSLLLFILIGVLVGSEGFGGIYFDDATLARSLGTVALSLILFAGGMETRWEAILPVIRQGLILSTAGTAVTAVVVGLFAHLCMNLSVMEGMLLGAIVSSTDAAAVFGVLRARSLKLKGRLVPLLEFESGTNDPTAVFLTLAITTALATPNAVSPLMIVGNYAVQLIIGCAAGVILGYGAALLINRIRLDYDGLYFAITLATAFLAYGGTAFMGGNGFVGVYVCGLMLGNRNFVHRVGLTLIHDGIAWLMQISMFLALGLLVYPSHLPPIAGPGMLIALGLVFIARPLAVFLCLMRSSFGLAEKAFISWAGLRGAVPIVLATIPLTERLPKAELFFNVVFFVVLVSVVLQGTTLGVVSRWLGVADTGEEPPEEKRVESNIVELVIPKRSPAVGKQVVDLNFPSTALIVLLTRNEETLIPRGSTVIYPNDKLLVATRKSDVNELKLMLLGKQPKAGRNA